MFGLSNIVEAKTKRDISSKAKYNYFSQDKNITNLSTQLPAKKGLLEKRESDQIRSIGNYQEKISAPRTHFEINISIYREENRIALKYEYVPDNKISPRIPIYQQIFREDVPNTHIYFIFPKGMILAKEMQTIITINNRTERLGSLSACSPEDTGFSQLLKKYNAAIEGTYDLTPSEKTELERAFDNTVNVIGGKTGRGIKIVKQGIKWGIREDERKRLKNLREKYGEEYQIYKMPFYVPEGITLAYTHIGRQSTLAFNLLELTEPTKVFIEIPQFTFELDASGATRRASLEGLAYEIMVEPYNPPEPNYTVESLYGEWEDVMDCSPETYSNHLIISKNRIRQQHNPRGRIISTDKCGTINPRGKNNTEYVMKEDGSSYYIKIVSSNVICYGREILKKVGAQEPKAVLIDKIIGTWEFIAKGSGSVKFKINKNLLIWEESGNFGTGTYKHRIMKTTKIDDVYFIKTICMEKDNQKRAIPQIFCIKIKNKDVIYVPQLSVQLRRQTSYQTHKPRNPFSIGSTTLKYVNEDYNIACMKLQTDGTFSISDEQADGSYKIEGIKGRYKVKGDIIIFTKNNGNKIMEVKIKDNCH